MLPLGFSAWRDAFSTYNSPRHDVASVIYVCAIRSHKYNIRVEECEEHVARIETAFPCGVGKSSDQVRTSRHAQSCKHFHDTEPQIQSKDCRTARRETRHVSLISRQLLSARNVYNSQSHSVPQTRRIPNSRRKIVHLVGSSAPSSFCFRIWRRLH